MFSKIKSVLIIFNTVAVISVIGFLGYHGPTLIKVTKIMGENEKRQKDLNTPKKINISNAELTKNSAVLGKKDAPITIVKFNSFSCGWCKRAKDVVHKIAKTYPNEVKTVYKHYSRGGNDVLTGQAAECAGEQGKFWKMYDVLFDVHSKEDITKAAQKVGLRMGKFNECLASGKYKNKVQQDSSFGRQLGIQGTPAFIVNGMLIKGYRDFKFFEAEIKKHLK